MAYPANRSDSAAQNAAASRTSDVHSRSVPDGPSTATTTGSDPHGLCRSPVAVGVGVDVPGVAASVVPGSVVGASPPVVPGAGSVSGASKAGPTHPARTIRAASATAAAAGGDRLGIRGRRSETDKKVRTPTDSGGQRCRSRRERLRGVSPLLFGSAFG
ncbi:hypothetical protein GCM10008995_03020 [Halobellus salinus]|uniref:Uncharacterized protein n=1 Tax=Halobellus salinus TaxID=931585 RepID=A0A830EBT4_9EURY|nr:hypothetical protein GCM10008995_03020 [Halobellus salinus]